MSEVAELYDRYSADVYRFSLWLCGDPALAQDITSETFLRVWSARDDLRLATVKAYLFAIARNLYLHERRWIRRQEPLPEERTDGSPGAETALESRARLAAVIRALADLPEADRSAVWMRAEGIAYAEIAAALGISEGTAKVRVHRARARLARLEPGERREK
jgi:RNA polymerase sigma-70 factor (ECF subfamily)